MRARWWILLVGAPIVCAFAGPAVLGYGWGRVLGASVAVVCAVIAAARLAPPEWVVCPDCEGSGGRFDATFVEDGCRSCNGRGAVEVGR